MIPKIFHRIWFGDRPRPERYDEYWQMWQDLHPDAEFHTWTEDNIPNLANQEAFDQVRSIAKSCGVTMAHKRAVAVQRADIVAYEIVSRFGGVYLNCDMMPLKNFDPLLKDNAFLGMEDDHHVCNAVMGGVPNHPLFENVIRFLPMSLAMHGNIGMEVATGPQHLTRVWRAMDYRDVKVHPVDTFYPVHHSQIPYGTENFDSYVELAKHRQSYAVHMWGHRSQEGRLYR